MVVPGLGSWSRHRKENVRGIAKQNHGGQHTKKEAISLPNMLWVHPDAKDAFALFLQHSQGKVGNHDEDNAVEEGKADGDTMGDDADLEVGGTGLDEMDHHEYDAAEADKADDDTNAADHVNWEGISISLEDDHDDQEGSEGNDASAFVMHEVFFSDV